MNKKPAYPWLAADLGIPAIPCHVIHAPNAALCGAAWALQA
ncbi:MAG: hypothetical protein ACREUV_08895 [Burkholderiales bacterium]